MKLKSLFYLCLFLVLFAACEDERDIEILTRQHRFSLNLGKMEDQIDLFQIPGLPQQTKNSLFLKNNMFYLANGNSAKVIKLTSFGDLLFMLYNPDTNPPPLVLKDIRDSEVVTNRFATKFNLRNIGEITVDSTDMFYLEDKVPSDRKIWDERLNSNLDSRVLKFNSKGELVDYIGQEGAGNSLFPYIYSLQCNYADELVVVCRIPTSWQVYWFSPTGQILNTLVLNLENHDNPEADFFTIDEIFPAYRSRRIYVHYTYYREVVDESTGTRIGMENLYSRIYTINAANGLQEKFIKLPDPGLRKFYTDSGEEYVPAPSFSFLGVTADEDYFLIRPDEEDRYQLLILDATGKIHADRSLIIEDQKLFYKQIKVTDTGLIYGLLCWQESAELVWWRSDKLLEDTNE